MMQAGASGWNASHVLGNKQYTRQWCTSATPMLPQVTARGQKGMISADAREASFGVCGYRQRVMRQDDADMVQ